MFPCWGDAVDYTSDKFYLLASFQTRVDVVPVGHFLNVKQQITSSATDDNVIAEQTCCCQCVPSVTRYMCPEIVHISGNAS